MIRKLSLLALFILMMVPRLNAQVSPCQQPPNCIVNGGLNTGGATGGDINTSGPTTVNGWYVSHGSPSISGDFAPGSSPTSIWMWSYSSHGEGIFTCYNFVKGKTYNICLWVKNTNAINLGNLEVYAANGLVPNYGSFGVPVPSGGSQLIANSHVWTGGWTLESYVFTPNNNYTQLWMYPFMTSGPINYKQYELEVDDIRVSLATKSTVTVKASKDTLTGCNDSTVLTVTGAPAGSTIGWSPSAGLNTTTGATVIAKPCSTTTYTVTITTPGSGGDCPTCQHATVKNITVVNNISLGHIVAPDSVNCHDTINLGYTPLDSCGATYTWISPLGDTLSTGPNASIPGATSINTGLYTLVIHYPNGCTYTLTKYITVKKCCTAHAAFTISGGCNPVSFTDLSSGSGTIIGWNWDFGDGNTSTLQNPSHSYATAGVYTVCLTITVQDGNNICYDKVCQLVQACDPSDKCSATANFSATQLASPANTMQFNDLSSGTGVICSYNWDFGDGNVSTLSNPTHTYAFPGGYTVCLTITVCMYDNQGRLVMTCTDKICKDISVQQGGHQPVQLSIDQQLNKGQAAPGALVIPNPATDNIQIRIQGFDNPVVTIKDATGKQVGVAKMEAKNALYTFNVQSLRPGVYVVEVRSVNAIKSVRFVKD